MPAAAEALASAVLLLCVLEDGSAAWADALAAAHAVLASCDHAGDPFTTALAEAARDGAVWLLASANLDPYPTQLQGQFAALAQLRAIETGRWLVSAANTGPSLVVDARGEVRQHLDGQDAGTLLAELASRTATTGYSRVGEWPLLALAAAFALVRFRSRVRQS